jgi:amidase/aspartyl-tRNA(Asn)/glutamyl-tRNA(Gln) amidotransferase subunit A
MALSDELAYMSATELALRIRRRELSPVEVLDAFLARIEARNPSLNALVYSGFEDARQRAQAAEQSLMSGAALGPLHGVPTAIKDLFDFKPGWVSTFGGCARSRTTWSTFTACLPSASSRPARSWSARPTAR